MGWLQLPRLREKAEEESGGTPTDYDSLDHEQVAKVKSKILKMNVRTKEITGPFRVMNITEQAVVLYWREVFGTWVGPTFNINSHRLTPYSSLSSEGPNSNRV